MKPFDVAHLASKRSCYKASEMCEAIKEVIYSYSEEMPLALAIGVLEIVKIELIDEGDEG
jgi:hypothetical protein